MRCCVVVVVAVDSRTSVDVCGSDACAIVRDQHSILGF